MWSARAMACAGHALILLPDSERRKEIENARFADLVVAQVKEVELRQL